MPLSDRLTALSGGAFKTLKRIPRASRALAARKLASIFDGITAKNEEESWVRLFSFPFRCFRTPRRGGHRRSLASEINQQLREEVDPPPAQLRPTNRPRSKAKSKPRSDPLSTLATRVASKLEEGDYRGAVRLACSEDAIADFNEETLAALQAKHPPPHPNTRIPPLPKELATISVSEEDVVHAIRSFPNGSAGGPDGLRPQHLKDLIGASAERDGKQFLRALTSFINLILEGRTPLSVRPTFFGASLIALNKKGGGIRPIAVGLSLRRLAAKCSGSKVLQSMSEYLAPLQLGFGTPLGAEAAAHSARLHLCNMSPSNLFLKLDFKNAFNSLRRDRMLEAVKERAPSLLPFVHSAYTRGLPPSFMVTTHCSHLRGSNKEIPWVHYYFVLQSTPW